MKWFGGVGIALLGIGAVASHYYEVGIGLGILGVGVILTVYGVSEKKKELTAKT